MVLKDTVKNMHQLFEELSHDLKKAERGIKAASQRVRTGTIRLAKLAKQYRKESMVAEQGVTKKTKKKIDQKKVTSKKVKTTRRKKKC